MREGAQAGSKQVRGGKRRLALGVALLGGALGCNDTPAASPSDTRVAARAEAPKPEQVVQRAKPAPASSAAPSAVPPRTSADEKAADEKAAAPQRITSKHIEDELNRLEAELK